MRRSRSALPYLTVAALVLAGCGDDGGGGDDGATTATDGDATSDGTGSTADGGDEATTGTRDDGDAGDGTADGEAPGGAGPVGGGDDQAVELGPARPGTWNVGGAGQVEFDVEDGSLVLRSHEATEGWVASVEEEDDDELEVVFTRDGMRWEFDVELDDGELQVALRQDVLDAEAGRYLLPDGGSFTFEADDGLTLADVSPGEAWEVVDREEDRDGFELELRDDARTVDVEVELDDGRIEVELDHEVVGPLPD